MKEKLIQKLFQGTCSKDELESLLRLIREDPSPPDPKLLEKLWEEMQGYPTLGDAQFDRIFSKTLSKIQMDKKSSGTNLSISILSMAASILVLLAIGLWFYNRPVEPLLVHTAFGEQQSMQLSDGSQVQLNANSQMSFQKDWGQHDDREVWLEGEAFFAVEKKPTTGQKMKVITNDLVIEVLGTTFNVNSKRERTTVYLQEGSIRLYLKGIDSVLQMNPGDLVIYSDKTGQFIKKRPEMAEVHTSWKDGVLTFNEAPLGEVLRRIEEIYGVKFKLAVDHIRQTRVNLPLPIHDLTTAISILDKTITSITITKQKDFYRIE